MSIETIILTFSYLGIFLLITLNGIISFPSSQLIYVIAGYFASTGDLNLYAIIIVGTIANTLGNVILYEMARRKGLKYTLKFFKYLELTNINIEKEIKKIKIVFKKKGTIFLFFGKLINPIKIFIPIVAGISKMNRAVYISIILITSTIWAIIFTLFGLYFGKSYENYGWYGLIMMVFFGTFLLIMYKYMNSEAILKELKN